MYEVAVRDEVIAQHRLVGADFGPESTLHSHHYTIEVRLRGASLGPHQFLVDITQVRARLKELTGLVAERCLNDLPPFASLNPSVEILARVACQFMAEGVDAPNIEQVQVQVWEDPRAWASYTLAPSA